MVWSGLERALVTYTDFKSRKLGMQNLPGLTVKRT